METRFLRFRATSGPGDDSTPYIHAAHRLLSRSGLQTGFRGTLAFPELLQGFRKPSQFLIQRTKISAKFLMFI